MDLTMGLSVGILVDCNPRINSISLALRREHFRLLQPRSRGLVQPSSIVSLRRDRSLVPRAEPARRHRRCERVVADAGVAGTPLRRRNQACPEQSHTQRGGVERTLAGEGKRDTGNSYVTVHWRTQVV